jgi:hypothetical protein
MTEAIETVKEPSATPCTSVIPTKENRDKSGASDRKAQLVAELRRLFKERKEARAELVQLHSECQRLGDIKELERTNRQLKAENEALLLRLANFEALGDPAQLKQLQELEAARRQARTIAWNNFISKCDVVRAAHPDFDAALEAMWEIPPSWMATIVSLPNSAEFFHFLARFKSLREYLWELKEPAACKRIEQAAYDLRQHKAAPNGGTT